MAPDITRRRVILDSGAEIWFDRPMVGARRVAVTGGGFIGCEIASIARERGLAVTLADRNPVLLRRSPGDSLGAAAGDLHRKAGAFKAAASLP